MFARLWLQEFSRLRYLRRNARVDTRKINRLIREQEFRRNRYGYPPTQSYWHGRESSAPMPLYMRGVSDIERLTGSASPWHGTVVYEYSNGARRVYSGTSETPGTVFAVPSCPCGADPGYHLRDTSVGHLRPGGTSCT